MDINLVDLARLGARQGYTLKQISELHGLSYQVLKTSLKSAGYTHPRGIALHKLRIETASGCSLDDVIRSLVQKGHGTVEVAKLLGMDAKTLKTYCASNEIHLNKNKPIPKRFDNIIAATRSRQRERNDLVWIRSSSGEKKYASEVARELRVSPSTIYKYHKHGLSYEQMCDMNFTSKVNQHITIDGETHTFREWCEKNAIQVATAMKRVRAGYLLSEAVTLPVGFKTGLCDDANAINPGSRYADGQGQIVLVQKVEEGFLEDDVLYQGTNLAGRLPMSIFAYRFKRME